MAHRNSPSSHALLSAFVLMLAAVGAQGCAAEDTDEVSATTGALMNDVIRLVYTDSRDATTFHVEVTAHDNATGLNFYGDVYVPGGMTTYPHGYNEYMDWTYSGLAQAAGIQPSAIAYIRDYSGTSSQFTAAKVKVTATINGSCHTDSETIAFGGNNHLEFTGWGGTWNGTCYVGSNLLTTHTPFYGP